MKHKEKYCFKIWKFYAFLFLKTLNCWIKLIGWLLNLENCFDSFFLRYHRPRKSDWLNHCCYSNYQSQEGRKINKCKLFVHIFTLPCPRKRIQFAAQKKEDGMLSPSLFFLFCLKLWEKNGFRMSEIFAPEPGGRSPSIEKIYLSV